MKRFLAGSVALLVACSLLAGCGDKKPAASGTAAAKVEQAQVQPPEEVLKAYITAMSQDKVDDALKLVYVPDFKNAPEGVKATPEEMQKSFTTYVSLMLHRSKLNLDKMGGLDTVTTGNIAYFSKGDDGKGVPVKAEDVKEGSIARVSMTMNLKSGQSRDADMYVLLTADGWRVIIPINNGR